MSVVIRGVRNSFRNKVRTLSIVIILGLSVGLSLSMLIAYQAVNTKIAAVKSSVGSTVSISPAGIRGFEGGGEALTATQINKVKTIGHVNSVDQTLSDRLTTSNSNLVTSIEAGSLGQRNANNSGQEPPSSGGAASGNKTTTRSFTPPVTLIGTTDPTNLSSTQGGGTFKLTDGKTFSSTSNEKVALIGKSLATKNNLKVGSTFTAYSTTIKVVGIFDSGNTFANNQVIMPLATVQKITSQTDEITSATVNVDSITNVDSVTTEVKKVLGSKADVTNASEQAKQTITPLENIKKISLYSLLGAVGAGAIIILLTMIMIVRERRREIGVLKAIGASNIVVIAQFVSESITLTLMGAVIGIGIGVFAANPITNMLVTNSASSTNSTGGPGSGPGGGAMKAFGQMRGVIADVQGVVDWTIVLYGLGVALVIAIIGSALASFFITKIRPAEVMRAE